MDGYSARMDLNINPLKGIVKTAEGEQPIHSKHSTTRDMLAYTSNSTN